MSPATLPSRELVAVDRVERGIVVLKNGGLRRIIIVSGINLELRSEEEQEGIIAGYQSFLNSLDFDLQIFIHSRKVNIAGYLEEMGRIAARERDSALGGLATEYKTFIEGFVAQNPIMEKRFFAVVPFDPVHAPDFGFGTLKTFKRLFARQAAPERAPRTPLTEEWITGLARRTDEVVSGLTQIGPRAVPLNDDEIAELLYNLYNPSTVGRRVSGEEVKTR